MAVIVEAVEPGTAVGIWPRVAAMIDAGAAKCDELVPEDILDRVANGKTLLWIAIEQTNGIIIAAMTTELVKQRSGLVCWMCQCGGDRLHDWSRFHTKIEEYARAEGCVSVVLEGREAWKRVLEGYTVRSVRLEKVL